MGSTDNVGLAVGDTGIDREKRKKSEEERRRAKKKRKKKNDDCGCNKTFVSSTRSYSYT